MRWGLLLVLAIVLGMSTPAPSVAAEEKDHAKEGAKEKHGEKHDDKHGGGHAAGDEKLDLFKGWIDLTVWTIAVFLILFGVLSYAAWPQIRAGLDKREGDIARAKAEAEKTAAEARELRRTLDAQMAKANDEVRTMIDKARSDAAATAAAEIAKGKAEIAAERARMREENARARDQALQEVWTSGASLATLISAKAIRKNLSEEDHRALVDEALREFRSAAEARLQDLTSAKA